MIHLRFAPAYDSNLWSGPLVPGSGQIGTRAVGLLGLLEAIEVHLGLAGPEVPPERRRLAYFDAIKKAGEGFWSASFKIDPISASERLLSLRDRLIESGWDGQAVEGFRKLEGLAQIEAQFKDRTGPADRLRSIEEALSSGASLPGIKAITLEVSEANLSARLKRVLALLRKVGVEVKEVNLNAQAPLAKKGDLLALTNLITQPADPVGDGSVRFVTARDHWESARMAAAWVASQPKEALNHLVVICPPRNRGILKTAFEARGIPFGGDHSEVSYARPSLQILILALNLAWAPKDPALALALMTVEGSPVPGKFKRKLIESLNESKAIGGTKWNQALQNALDERLKETPDLEEQEKLKKGAERVREWFSAPAFSIQDGIPQTEVQTILNRVKNWLSPRASETKGIIELLSLLVMNLNESKISLERLFQLLMEVVGDGVASLLDPARALGPRVVDSPAAISGPADTILWWDFVEASAPIERDAFFSKVEIEALKTQGIEWPDFGARLIEQGASYHRGVRMTKERVLFFNALMDQSGNGEGAHPLHSELIPDDIQSEWAAKTGIRLTEANDPAVVEFLMSTGAVSVPTQKELLDDRRVEWKIPAPGPGLRTPESASSLEQLLGCELAYLLRYPAKLRGEDRESVQYDESTKGIIAHAVLAGVFEKGATLSPVDARKKAETLFDGIAMDHAPLLFQKAQSGERFALKERIFRAVETYGAFIEENQLQIDAAEMDVSSSQLQIAGVALTGSIDHVLKDSKQRTVIVDHKWGKKGYKQKALEEGTSLQLALYSLLISGDVNPVLAYHMILARDVLVLNEPYRRARNVKGPKGTEVLAIAEREVEKAKAILANGAIWARGLMEESGGESPRHFEAPCRFCDYKKICGKFFEVEEK